MGTGIHRIISSGAKAEMRNMPRTTAAFLIPSFADQHCRPIKNHTTDRALGVDKERQRPIGRGMDRIRLH